MTMPLRLASALFAALAVIALPASDDFNRANDDPLGDNWTTLEGNWKIYSGRTEVTTGSFAFNSAYWDADAFSADHYAQVLIVDSTLGGPAVRLAATRGYYAQKKFDATGIELYRYTGAGTATLLQTITPAWVNGDTVKLQMVSSTLKLFVNGVQVGTDQTDATYTGGAPGMFTQSGGGAQQLMDDFVGNDVGGAAPRPCLQMLLGAGCN